jgi:hypothetical protein
MISTNFAHLEEYAHPLLFMVSPICAGSHALGRASVFIHPGGSEHRVYIHAAESPHQMRA